MRPILSIQAAGWASLLVLATGCGRLVGADFDGLTLRTDDGGQPGSEAGTPEICNSGGCVAPPSCGGLPPICGPNQNEDCCKSLIVPGGTFNRDNNPAYPATISRFALDAYEVTVGRFRGFLARFPKSPAWPDPGDGAHPKWGQDTGWQIQWDPFLPPSSDAENGKLAACAVPHAWTAEAGPNENLPVACITWYFALAFCAWDGGRLPTDAEWSYVAVGGDQQRVYPWSDPPSDETIDKEHASYGCGATGDCSSLLSLNAAGTRPKGNGRWGHADLAGNLSEWTGDSTLRCEPNDSGDCPACEDCVNKNPQFMQVYRITHGGGFLDKPEDLRLDTSRSPEVTNYDNFTFERDLGFRCARDL